MHLYIAWWQELGRLQLLQGGLQAGVQQVAVGHCAALGGTGGQGMMHAGCRTGVFHSC